jgi:hypothetical protein
MVDNKSELLFGGDFPQQITVLNQGVKIGRGRKFGMNQGFLRKRFQPYQNQRAHGGFRQPFLGENIVNGDVYCCGVGLHNIEGMLPYM